MFYKLGKALFEYLVNILKFIQIGLIFLSFFVILYWLLQLGGATYLGPVAPFFEAIKDFTHIYYQRTIQVEEATIDFSFLIASFVFLIIVWLLKFIIEDIEIVEKRYDTIYENLRKKAEKLFNIGLEQQYIIHEHKNNKFVLFIKLKATNLAKDSLFHKDSMVGVDEKEQAVLAEFIDSLNENFKFQKRFMYEGFLLYFDKFDEIDNVVYCIENIIISIQNKYRAEKWQIRFYASVEPYSQQKELMTKAKNVLSLVKLGLTDEIVSLGTLKQRYALIKNPKCIVEGKGIYKVEIGEEEVFCIKTLK